MRVLHVYRHDNPRLAEYVRLLMQNMPADVECAFADNASDVRLAIKDFQPDIIHQHGQPIANIQYPTVQGDLLRQQTLHSTLYTLHSTPPPTPPVRLVVSPHGDYKSPSADISRAYVVIARSPYELSCCDTERKELVRNPLITKTISFDEAAAAIRVVYQRVMDSNPLELMDDKSRRLLAVLLKAGLLGDKRWVSENLQFDNLRFDNLRFPTPITQHPTPNTHHLFIYAELVGVLDIVKRGIAVLGFDCPEMPTVDCYLPHGYKKPEPLADATIPEILRDIEANGLTLLRLTEMMKLLYDDGLDEGALMEQIEGMNARQQLQQLLQLLSEQLLLTEGFMPCPPLDNSFTENLRQQIENHLRIV